MKKLEKKELELIQSLNSRFNQIKSQIGDIEMQKSILISESENIRREFAANEKQLMSKYGEDAVINLQTGEVTKKKE